jgi:hypothetical protein
MADIDAPNPRDSVQIALALHIEHIGAAALRDDESAFFLKTRKVGE